MCRNTYFFFICIFPLMIFLFISWMFFCRTPSLSEWTKSFLCQHSRFGTRGTSSCHSPSYSSSTPFLSTTTTHSTGKSFSASGHTTTAQGHWEATMICCTSTAERSSRVQVQQHSLVEKMENAALGTYSKLKNKLNTKNWKEKKWRKHSNTTVQHKVS